MLQTSSIDTAVGASSARIYYDVIRLARRGRTIPCRVYHRHFIGFDVATSTSRQQVWHQNDFARCGAIRLCAVVNLAIFVLTPAYLGSAISEEERRTLEPLFDAIDE